MGKWYVGFDRRWQESFHDLDEATEWAQEVAATGRTVDVAQRYFLIGKKFVTAFPESERELREAIWKAGSRMWVTDGS
ncbi:MAG TPA: hypothetical protein VLI94_12095 [Solirubrobacterales bacterium]|nr:hypothetical protein [Solirubrobacterales bacterium]